MSVDAGAVNFRISAQDMASGAVRQVQGSLQGLSKVADEQVAKNSTRLGGLQGAIHGFSTGIAGAMTAPIRAVGGLVDVLGNVGLAAMGIGALGASVQMLGSTLTEPIRKAQDFQAALTGLVTGAGESEAALGQVRAGVLALAGEVGAAPTDLAKGLYMIESAGFHGAAGLDVLRAAAIGAKVGMASQESVANAVTSALNAYGLAGKDAMHVTDLLVQTVASGKMHMDDLASSLGTVLPAAAAAHVGLAEIGAAIATMTMQGTDAATATTQLRMVLGNLQSPSSKAVDALKAIGLSSTAVGKVLTTQGLLPALQLVQEHLDSKLPRGSAAANAALVTIFGGVKSGQAALELMNGHLGQFATNLKGMGDASKGAGKTLEGWALAQQDAGVAGEKLSGSLDALKIGFGTGLLSVVAKVEGGLAGLVQAITPLATSIGDLLGSGLSTAIDAVSGAFSDLSSNAGLQALATFLENTAQYGSAFAQGFEKIPPELQGVASALGPLVGVGQKAIETIRLVGRYLFDAARYGEPFAQGFKNLPKWVQPAVKVVAGFIQRVRELTVPLGNVGKFLLSTLRYGRTFAQDFEKIPLVLQPLVSDLGNMANAIHDLGDSFGDLLSGQIDLGTFFQNVQSFIGQQATNVWAAIGDLFNLIPWASIWQTVQSLAGQAFSFALNVGGKIFDWAKGIFDGIKWSEVWGTVSTLAGKAFTFTANVIGTVTDWIAKQFSGITWSDVWGKVKVAGDWISGLWDKLMSPGSPQVIDVGVGMQLKTNPTQGIGSKLLDWFKGIWPTPEQWTSIWGTVSATASAAFTWAVDIAGKISSWFGEQFSAIQWDKVWAGIKVAGDWAAGLWDKLFAPGTTVPINTNVGMHVDTSKMPQQLANAGVVTQLLDKFNQWLYGVAQKLDSNPELLTGAKALGNSFAKAIGGAFTPNPADVGSASTAGLLMEAGAKLGASFTQGIINAILSDETTKNLGDAINKMMIRIMVPISQGPLAYMFPGFGLTAIKSMFGSDYFAYIDEQVKKTQKAQGSAFVGAVQGAGNSITGANPGLVQMASGVFWDPKTNKYYNSAGQQIGTQGGAMMGASGTGSGASISAPITIIVNGSTDPQATADAIYQKLAVSFRGLAQQLTPA